jgi:hypothetical protein
MVSAVTINIRTRQGKCILNFCRLFSELEYSSHEMDSLGMSEHLYSIRCGEGAGRAAAFPFPPIVTALDTS